LVPPARFLKYGVPIGLICLVLQEELDQAVEACVQRGAQRGPSKAVWHRQRLALLDPSLQFEQAPFPAEAEDVFGILIPGWFRSHCARLTAARRRFWDTGGMRNPRRESSLPVSHLL
jgi:hypothetical protein